MFYLNRYWILLMLLGLLVLVLAVTWDVYQITSGGRSEVNNVIIGFNSNKLIPGNIEEHFLQDSEYDEFTLKEEL